MSDFLKEKLVEIGLTLTEDQIVALDRYYEMLVEKNKVMNLTAITEYEDVVIKHFVDSLAIVHAMDLSQVQTVLDIGTGAGFPGMVLKIAYPHLQITLLDSLNKRIGFLKEVAEELHLTEIQFLHGRAEDYAQNKNYREQYDLVVSRAVANLSTLSEYCIPYVRNGKCFISYKSGESEEEINEAKHAIGILGGKIRKVVPCVLPGTDISRAFVVIEKVKPTGSKYPRKAGLPSKDPIK